MKRLIPDGDVRLKRITNSLNGYDLQVHGQLQRIECPLDDALVVMCSEPCVIIPSNIIPPVTEDINIDPLIVTSPSVARTATFSNIVTPPPVAHAATNPNNSSPSAVFFLSNGHYRWGSY